MMRQVAIRTKQRMTDLDAFITQAEQYDLIPLVLEMDMGEETLLSIYRTLSTGKTNSFLLESSHRKGKEGRYSFIGVDPERIFRVTGEGCAVLNENGDPACFYPLPGGTRDAINDYLSCRRPPVTDDLPPFAGGVAGYFGYGMVEKWEDLFHGTERKLNPSSHDAALLMGFVTVVALDHETEQILLVHNIRISEGTDQNTLKTLYRDGAQVLENIADRIEEGATENPSSKTFFLGDIQANIPKSDFLEMVRKGREHIMAGDICQVVLSQRFTTETNLPSLEIYRSLKEINPSPYLFYLNLPGLELIGSSPEVLVRVEGEHITTRPLAGTRRRGNSEIEDRILAKELLSDEKERAEHLMLVDLSRNDLGRVCRTGTVAVTELMGLEYYSQVMHIVSQVEGDKREKLSSLDVLESAFPAGTVSGAPKIRAMEIIEELEPYPRGPYAGAVGYMGFDGDLDTCIVIRTLVREGNTISVQAGAGIVYDSVPEKEYEETRSKARALLRALEMTLERRNAR